MLDDYVRIHGMHDMLAHQPRVKSNPSSLWTCNWSMFVVLWMVASKLWEDSGKAATCDGRASTFSSVALLNHHGAPPGIPQSRWASSHSPEWVLATPVGPIQRNVVATQKWLCHHCEWQFWLNGQKRFSSSLDCACCSSSRSAKEAPYWCKFNYCHWLHGPQRSDPHKSTPGFDSAILMRISMVVWCSTFMWVSVHLITCAPKSLPTLPTMESGEVQNSISIPCPVKPEGWGSGTATSAGAWLKFRASREILEASDSYTFAVSGQSSLACSL